MNWGNKLLVVFIAFAGLMSYMVYRCSKTSVDLVTKEYYQDELVYQDVIDGTQKANALSSRVRLEEAGKLISVQFPKEMKNSAVTGSFLFYCAADAGKDRKIPVKLNPDAQQQLRIDTIPPGNYTVKIQWASNGNRYYAEQPFTVH